MQDVVLQLGFVLQVFRESYVLELDMSEQANLDDQHAKVIQAVDAFFKGLVKEECAGVRIISCEFSATAYKTAGFTPEKTSSWRPDQRESIEKEISKMKMTTSGDRIYDLGCAVPPQAQDSRKSNFYVNNEEKTAALEELETKNWKREAAFARLRRSKSQKGLLRNASGNICCDWHNCEKEFENSRLFYVHRLRDHVGQCDCGYSLEKKDETLFLHRESVDHSYKCGWKGCGWACTTTSNVPLSGSVYPIYSPHFLCLFGLCFLIPLSAFISMLNLSFACCRQFDSSPTNSHGRKAFQV